MEAEIRPTKIEILNNKQIYFLDQFHWYADGIESGSVPYEITRRSAVSFEFPHSPGELSRAELLVLGERSELEAYLLSIDDKRRNIIRQVFAYPGSKERIKLDILNVDAIPSPNVFTTQEKPFLYRGEKKSDFSREYNFNLFGGEYFKVIAQRKDSARYDYMELRYLPDSRDSRPLTIAKIVNDGKRWFLEDI